MAFFLCQLLMMGDHPQPIGFQGRNQGSVVGGILHLYQTVGLLPDLLQLL